jgi:hypothetical protein
MYVCMFVCTYVCVCMCVYVCVYVLFFKVHCLSHYSGNTTSFTNILVDMYSYLVIPYLICQVQLFGYSTILTINLVNV